MNRQNVRRGREYARSMRAWLRILADPEGERDPARRAVARALSARVTARQMECLRRYYERGENLSAIGVALGLDGSTVSRHLRRGEDNIQEVLELVRTLRRTRAS